MPGPPRKRDAERRRRNKDDVETIKVDLDQAIHAEIEIQAPPEPWEDKDGNERGGWHKIAEDAYLSLAKSGQAIFLEPSDWATAYILCETLSRELNPKPIVVQVAEGETEVQWVMQPVNGSVLSAFLKGWSNLMATEGDRRRLRIELNRQARRDEAASAGTNVVSITQNREDVFNRRARG